MPFFDDCADFDFRSELSDEQLERLERRQPQGEPAPIRYVGADRARLEQRRPGSERLAAAVPTAEGCT